MLQRFWIKVSNNHDTIYKYFLIVTTVILIVIALPKQSQFNYTYKEGKPWTYENLMAPFDYAIYKSDLELNRERAEAVKGIYPFFSLNETLASEKINSFRNEIESRKDSFHLKNFRQLADKGEEILGNIYSKGIIQVVDSSSLGGDSIINLLENNIAEEHFASEFFTIQSAYEEIKNQLKGSSNDEKNIITPFLENALAQNIIYDDVASRQWSKQVLENISPVRGMVQNGEVIVLRGQVVDDNILLRLESLRKELRNQDYTGNLRNLLMLGNFILISLSMTMLILFLHRFRREFYNDNARIMLLMLLILLMVFSLLWARKIALVDMYIVPVCILPIVVRTFFDSRTALFTHVITLLIIGFEAPNSFEFMFIQTIAGMVATFSIIRMSRRSQFFFTVSLIFLSYTISFVGVSIIHEANFKTIDWSNLKWFAGNSLITLFAFPLIYIFEKSFGLLSDISMMELSDSNSPLLRELSLKAPGTFQHSLQVANLAEAATYRISGNPMLARTGAMYHDIGKIDIPYYFIENQSAQRNPHDSLTFEESARVIKSHVIRGIEKARKGKIPEPIIDFIRSHHGTTRLQYFYQSFLKNYPDKIPDEDQFRYPGPLPFSKETAVVMMADSVEAASRSLGHPDEKSIEDLIEKIIGSQLEQKQFINCPVTLKDISDMMFNFYPWGLSINVVKPMSARQCKVSFITSIYDESKFDKGAGGRCWIRLKGRMNLWWRMFNGGSTHGFMSGGDFLRQGKKGGSSFSQAS